MYSSCIGFSSGVWQLLDDLQLPFDLTLHDHSIFTGNPSLLDAQGRFDSRWLDEGLSALPVRVVFDFALVE